MPHFFITGIGTDIGKTYIGASLLAEWREAGNAVDAVKPLMSGFGEDDLAASDAGRLLEAMGKPITETTLNQLCMHRFEAAIAPNVAMREANVKQDYPQILSFIRQRIEDAGEETFCLVEGAGGVMSPVTDDTLHIDMMADLDLPVILVAANYLGAVSHTLTAAACLKARGIEIAAIIVSQPTPDALPPKVIIPEFKNWITEPCFAVEFGEPATKAAKALTASTQT